MNKRSFIASAINVLTGSVAAQLISTFATIITAKLYSPSEVGDFTAFISIVSIINCVSTLKYDAAIPVAFEKRDVKGLLHLSMLTLAIVSFVSLVMFILFSDLSLLDIPFADVQNHALMLSAAILCVGASQILVYTFIRFNKYKQISFLRVIQPTTNLVVVVAAHSLGSVALMMAYIVSNAFTLCCLLKIFMNKTIRPKVNPLIKLAKKYNKFPLFETPSSLVNILGSQLPILLILNNFGPEFLGQMAMAEKILLLPATLIGNSVSSVFLGASRNWFIEGSLKIKTTKLAIMLFLLSLPIGIALIIVSDTFLPFVFGDQWSETFELLPLLFPLFIGKFVVPPLSNSFFAMHKLQSGFVAQLMLSLTRILPLFLYLTFTSSTTSLAVAMYSFAAFIGYTLYFNKMLNSIRKHA